jgi:hypothetical protein
MPAENVNVYWHRELPPPDTEPLGEYTIEADSLRVPGVFSHRNDLWERCERDLTHNVSTRLEQEIRRLGGRCAHVLDERIDAKHDDAADEAWLHGRYTYVLYR